MAMETPPMLAQGERSWRGAIMNIGAKENIASFAKTIMRSWADLSASFSRCCTNARDSLMHTGDVLHTKLRAKAAAASLHLPVDFD